MEDRPCCVLLQFSSFILHLKVYHAIPTPSRKWRRGLQGESLHLNVLGFNCWLPSLVSWDIFFLLQSTDGASIEHRNASSCNLVYDR